MIVKNWIKYLHHIKINPFHLDVILLIDLLIAILNVNTILINLIILLLLNLVILIILLLLNLVILIILLVINPIIPINLVLNYF